MNTLIGELEALCSSTQAKLLLVAPFIKAPVLARLLDRTMLHVDVCVVTRWRPQEIKAGVSDIEIWDLLKERPRTALMLRQDLHAKYYRGDDQCLVGSANLTGTALGLSRAGNLELLLPVAPNHVGLEGFEQRLLAGAVAVDDRIVDLTRAAVDVLPKLLVVDEDQAPGTLEGILGEVLGPETWVPTLRQPEDLFMAYSGDQETLSGASQRAAASDLAVLRIPFALDEPTFNVCVAAALMRMPIVVAVDGFVVEPRRFGEMRDLLTRLRGPSISSERDWQVMFRWIMHFLPQRFEYRRPRYSELIARR
jgi:hypothetical protein